MPFLPCRGRHGGTARWWLVQGHAAWESGRINLTFRKVTPILSWAGSSSEKPVEQLDTAVQVQAVLGGFCMAHLAVRAPEPAAPCLLCPTLSPLSLSEHLWAHRSHPGQPSTNSLGSWPVAFTPSWKWRLPLAVRAGAVHWVAGISLPCTVGHFWKQNFPHIFSLLCLESFQARPRGGCCLRVPVQELLCGGRGSASSRAPQGCAV